MVQCKFLLILLKECQGILLFLDRIDPAFRCAKCHFDRNRTCSCTNVVADGIFWKSQFGERNGTHFCLGHRCLAADKFFVWNSMSCQFQFCLWIICTDYAQRISLIGNKFSGWFRQDLLVIIGKIFSDMKNNVAHSVKYKLLCQFTHSVTRSEDCKNLAVRANQGNEIAGFSMRADDLCVVPGQADL